TNRKINYSVEFPDNATFRVIPRGRLKSGENYLLKLDFKRFKDIAGNYYDSVYTFKFSTIYEIDFTGASGIIVNVQLSDNPFVVLQSTDKTEGKTYQQYLQDGNKFEFNRVLPGKYLLWCFLDRDNNGAYNRGKPSPFTPSEDFSFYPDTLNLRARWGQMDIRYVFK
ncbi:MAG TPA: hypothetical protein VLB50_08125, partial [Ignavibacteriaceae bacterium]|nr:hypothetical protein [Ignavibacteriaceae bacterium]